MKFFLIFLLAYFLLPADSSFAGGSIFPDKELKMAYMTYCAECHGRTAKGGYTGPKLRKSGFLKKLDSESIAKIISDGVSKKATRFQPGEYEEGMAGFSKNLSPDEINKLTALMKQWNQ